MTTFTSGRAAADFILSEANGQRSRGVGTLLSGQIVKAGMVLGKITLGAATTAFAGTGNGTITMDATTPVLSTAKVGAYTATCITSAANGGTFRVEDPSGAFIGEVAVGATFSEQIKFVIADGATDFVVGDKFTITVAAGSGKYKAVTAAATDGSQNAAAIAIYATDATGADTQISVIERAAEVNGKLLSYGADIDTDAEKTAVHTALAGAGVGIIVR
ncbi:hypothetical protein AA309_20190 [Microvirga vignae]|uniref:Head decoration protein n=1 Tax=Microvirga vignae TaxID=1225564 RepID=A0A0H1RFP2_9HYPH|nr:head decoration protein [Microvirga vignae]KLK91417.1 hypothetical protein AA309_20190 [Microvirga vignae]